MLRLLRKTAVKQIQKQITAAIKTIKVTTKRTANLHVMMIVALSA